MQKLDRTGTATRFVVVSFVSLVIFNFFFWPGMR